MVEAYIVSIIAILLAYRARFERYQKALPWAFVIITIFLSLGYMWGNDVPTYELWFWNFTEYKPFDFDSIVILSDKSEYGYVLINQLCKPIGFWGMRAVLFAFENYVIYQLVKRTVPREYYWLALFVYTFNPYFMILSSSMMRQWLAMCIVILGFLYLEKRRWILYIALVLLASTIHRSSIICLPLVVLPYITYKFKKSHLILIIPALAAYYVFSGYVVQYVVGWLMTEDMYTNYTDSMYSSGVGIMAILHLLIYVFMFANISQIDKEKRIYIAVLICFGLILPLYNFSGLASRLGFYFTVFTICAYPLFFKQSQLDKSYKTALIIAVIVVILYSNILFYADPVWLYHFGKYTTLFKAGIL